MRFNEVKSTTFNRNSRERFKPFLKHYNRFFITQIFSRVQEIQSVAQNSTEVV
jgi:hypothetical protein